MPVSWRGPVDAVSENYPGRMSMDQDADDFAALIQAGPPAFSPIFGHCPTVL